MAVIDGVLQELHGFRDVTHEFLLGTSRRNVEFQSHIVFLHTEEARQALDERLLHAELVMPYLHAIWRRVVAAEALLAPAGTELSAGSGAAGRAVPAGGALTEREREILQTYSLGATLRETSQKHQIAESTVREHYRRVVRRYEEAGRPIGNKAQLLLEFMADGWVRP